VIIIFNRGTIMKHFINFIFGLVLAAHAHAAGRFTQAEMQGHLAAYNSNPAFDSYRSSHAIHPAYALLEYYATPTFSGANIKKAQATSIAILTEGYGFGGFNTTRKANEYEQSSAMFAISLLMRNDSTASYNALAVRGAPASDPVIQTHLNFVQNAATCFYGVSTRNPIFYKSGLKGFSEAFSQATDLDTNLTKLFLYTSFHCMYFFTPTKLATLLTANKIKPSMLFIELDEPNSDNEISRYLQAILTAQWEAFATTNFLTQSEADWINSLPRRAGVPLFTTDHKWAALALYS
jgi:hypothetical protein